MTIVEIKEYIKNCKDYSFLNENINLSGRIGMLCLGGSLAYGTNIPGKGDIDLRGFAFESKAELIGLVPSFNQVVEPVTDTTIYAFNKLIGLLLDNNPNTIEQLGCKEEHYFYLSDIAKELLRNKSMFLSKRCINSFAGYANQQLNRLENAIARDSLTQSKKEEHIRLSMENARMSFNQRYKSFDNGSMKLYIDKSEKENLESEIFIDMDLSHYPVRDLTGMINEFTNITKQYGKINHRNSKKDAEHLDKHAMHLVRLYLMAFDLMENQKIVTFRAKDRDFLLEIRKGKYRNEDGTYSEEFFELRKKLDARFQYAVRHTELPENPDMKMVNDFVVSINEKIVRGEV